ncbi:Flp family type IVb pilin [Prosthecochloris sp. N3]|uniref:Flp family type IVb pilin n=1 Tax=Prosthecochloris ethylica TaxID=2743976 RepID=A0ABR9XPL6_9CHLB|nr:Flp family type IVb pilin [Prosthecochloris ethylica]MBF0586280.1 Flp family type IVb pilin [Prosthecochloris ethylica]MBF0635986.1 Flp family type IVb pilin [Prosthecochloris ethylica]NUK47339.1 Flp family type IVb pilin [Prosthecochloris ethylica]
MSNSPVSTKKQKGISIIQYACIAVLSPFKSRNSIKSQKGVTMIEYALIAALITIVVLVTLQAIGPQLNTTFNSILTAITNANSSS